MKQFLISGMYYVLIIIISTCFMICYERKCKRRITNWFNRIVQVDDTADVEPLPPPTSLFVDTSINRPSSASLMIESDQDKGDEENPYLNIGLPPTTMVPTAPIVQQPVTVSSPIPPTSLPQRSSSVMLSDDEQKTDEEQGANQYITPVNLQDQKMPSTNPSVGKRAVPIPSSVNADADKITPVPSSSKNIILNFLHHLSK